MEWRPIDAYRQIFDCGLWCTLLSRTWCGPMRLTRDHVREVSDERCGHRAWNWDLPGVWVRLPVSMQSFCPMSIGGDRNAWNSLGYPRIQWLFMMDVPRGQICPLVKPTRVPDGHGFGPSRDGEKLYSRIYEQPNIKKLGDYRILPLSEKDMQLTKYWAVFEPFAGYLDGKSITSLFIRRAGWNLLFDQCGPRGFHNSPNSSFPDTHEAFNGVKAPENRNIRWVHRFRQGGLWGLQNSSVIISTLSNAPSWIWHGAIILSFLSCWVWFVTVSWKLR